MKNGILVYYLYGLKRRFKIMDNIKFYVFTNKGIKSNLGFKEAIREYKALNDNETNGYKAIGIIKEVEKNEYACDLLNNLGENSTNKISNDYTQLQNFKDDNLIKINVIEILKREFNL
jgi:hypothetical protein